MPPYGYAQLPAFHYQTFDRYNLQFSYVPIIPPPPAPTKDSQGLNGGGGSGAEDKVPDPPSGVESSADGTGKQYQHVGWSFALSVTTVQGQPDTANLDEQSTGGQDAPADTQTEAEDVGDGGAVPLNPADGTPSEDKPNDEPSTSEPSGEASSEAEEVSTERSEPKEAEFPPIDPAAGTTDAVDEE
ncbi:hypothetical protein MMC06_005562, partial [Schaereria dolodes]|nr:hypothetical protein [Schaereria dolodes]